MLVRILNPIWSGKILILNSEKLSVATKKTVRKCSKSTIDKLKFSNNPKKSGRGETGEWTTEETNRKQKIEC